MNRFVHTYRPGILSTTLSCPLVGFASTGKGPRKGWRTPLNTIMCREQRDAETRLSYFGARYYDSDLLTGWLSVDPMSDKYPSMSSYSYCASNPLKLVDPDGREIWINGANGESYQYMNGCVYTSNGEFYGGADSFVMKIRDLLNDVGTTYAGASVINKLIASSQRYTYTNEAPKSNGASACFVDASRVFKLGNNPAATDFAHETFHAYQYDLVERGKTVTREVGARLFTTMMSFQLNGKPQWNLADQTSGMEVFSTAMTNLLFYGFDKQNYATAVTAFFESSLSGPQYYDEQYKIGNISDNPPIKRFLPL